MELLSRQLLTLALDINGSIAPDRPAIADAQLSAYMGDCRVIDLSANEGKYISGSELREAWTNVATAITESNRKKNQNQPVPRRILLKTQVDSQSGGRHLAADCIPVLQELGVAVVGLDTARLAPAGEHDELLADLTAKKLLCLLNLELRGVTNGACGYLMVSPWKLTEKQRFTPARVIVVER